MKFKIEVQIPSGRTVTDYMFAKTLDELDNKIKIKYPKAKVVSTIGGDHDGCTDEREVFKDATTVQKRN